MTDNLEEEQQVKRRRRLMELTSVDVETVGLVERGAVGENFFLLKSQDGEPQSEADQLRAKIEALQKLAEPVQKAVNDGFLSLRLPAEIKDEIEQVAKYYDTTTSEVTRAYLAKGLLAEYEQLAKGDTSALKREYTQLIVKAEYEGAEDRDAALGRIWSELLELAGGDEDEATRLFMEASGR